jgi:hypothetical protein
VSTCLSLFRANPNGLALYTPTENTNRIANAVRGKARSFSMRSRHRPRPMTMEIIIGRAVISPTVRRNSPRASELYETYYCES